MKSICKGPCFKWLTIEHCLDLNKEGLAVVFNDGNKISIVEDEVNESRND